MIKPIETIYKGYRFRSRLEARWAVFFDEIGLKWEYEKEGFDVDGKWYLPDFYLPSLNLWLEIKPGEPRDKYDWDWPDNVIHQATYDKDGFASKEPLIDLIVLKGNPFFDEENDGPEYVGYVPGDYNYWFCACPKCGKIGIEFDGRGARVCAGKCEGGDKGYTYNLDIFKNGYLKAKQARFEHGECG